MKKIIVILLVLMVCAATISVVAANEAESGSGSGGDDSGVDDRENRSVSELSGDDSVHSNETDIRETISPRETEHGIEIENKTEREDESEREIEVEKETEHEIEIEGNRTNVTELEIKIKERESEIEREIEREGIEDRVIVSNQSHIILGIEALQLVKELQLQFGENLSELEVESNESINITIRAEERIRSRNAVIRFFIGGDDNAAREIEREQEKLQDRINRMEQLIERCNCSEQVKEMLKERIRDMEQEQERLHTLSQLELEDKGIIGWIWK